MGAGFVSAGGMKWNDSDLQKCTFARVSSLIPEVVLTCFVPRAWKLLAPMCFAGSNQHHLSSSQQDKNIQTREGKLEADARYEAACNRLANKAVQRGSADNVTVMVVRIEH